VLRKTLASPTAPQALKSYDLVWLLHLVGDLHQPLHAGRPQDRGGNEIYVSFFGEGGGAGRRMELHSLWDSGILRRAHLRWPASADELIAGISTVDVSAWSNSDVVGWTNESYRLDEEFVYSVRAGGDVANAYYSRALPIARRRIQQGGIRLAHLLNEAARGRFNITL
ncbi:MAG TPA: S1/P1 nuclease, partial [Longimicrobiales bacterium]